MKILTGQDRKEYEDLVATAAHQSAQAALLHDQLARLDSELGYLREQLHQERARANQAVDALLVSKGQAPVTPNAFAQPDDLFLEDPATVSKLEREIAVNPLAVLSPETHNV